MSSNPFYASTTFAAPNGATFTAGATVSWDSNYYVTVTDLWCELPDSEWTWRVTGSYSAGDRNEYVSENKGLYSFQGRENITYVWGACAASNNQQAGTWTNDNGVFTLTGNSSGGSSGGDSGGGDSGSTQVNSYTVYFDRNGETWDYFPSSVVGYKDQWLTLPTPTRNPSNQSSSSFNITGYANGGESDSSLSVTKSVQTTYSGIWRKAATGDAAEYSFGDKVDFSYWGSSTTLYSKQSSSQKTTYSNNKLSDLTIPNPPSTSTETITVYFNSNGGSITNIDPKTTTKITTYTFNKWTTDQAGYTDAPASFTTNSTVYAQWNNNESITEISLPYPGEKPGYIFAGWSDGVSEVIYNTSYTPKSNITLYAQWAPNSNTQYTVNYYIKDLNADTYSLYESETKYGTTDSDVYVNTLSVNIDGFTYKEAKSNGSLVSQITIKADGTSSIDLYYTRNSYNVTLNKSDDNIFSLTGSGTYEYGATVKINATYEEIYHFTGWTGDITNQNANATFTMPSNNVNLTANVAINTYSIVFNGNGGEGYVAAIRNITCIEEVTLPANKFTKTGYAFNGWNKESNGSGTHYKDGATVSTLSFTHDDTVTLYAEWLGDAFTITFDANGGIGGPITGAKEYNVSYIIPDTVPTLEGYTFQGWSTTKGSSSVAYRPGDTYTVNEDLVLYAVWKVGVYTNTINHYMTGFKNNEGNANNGKYYLLKTETFTQEYNTSFNISSNKALTRIPNGFTLNNNCGVIINGSEQTYSIGSSVTQAGFDIVINYYYDPTPFNITYTLNGGTNSVNNPKTYNVLYPVVFEEATKIGFKQSGWFDNKNQLITGINTGINNSFTNVDDLYNKLSARTTGNIIVIAKWESFGILHILSADGSKKEKYQCGIYNKKTGKWMIVIPYKYNKSKDTWSVYFE